MNTRRMMRAAALPTTLVALSALQLASASAATVKAGTTPAISINVATTSSTCGQAGTGKRALCGLGIRVSHLSAYDSFVTCLGCAGSWGNWSKVGGSWVAKSAGPIQSRASVLLVVTQPGHVGRYALYRPADVNGAQARLKLHQQGCIAANIPASTIYKSFGRLVRNLPTVPCKAPNPKHLTALAYTAGLNELSTSNISHALVYGKVSTPMWLTLVQTTRGTCKADPYAYSQAQRHSKIWYTWKLKKGQFEEGLQTRALAADGRFCIYLQTGGLYHGYPDGWAVLWAYNDYGSGDMLTGPASTSLSTAGATTVTLTGVAPRTETLETYDSLYPCPEVAEFVQYTGFGGVSQQVSGSFTRTFTTANFSQSSYVCSYLHSGYNTVAMTTDQVLVAGTQFKVQSDYSETADQSISTLSNPVGDTGTAGPGIAAGQTVQVRCLVNGLGLAPFDPVWYEVASAPWNDAYYVPAYAFYNNGQTSGTEVGGRLWDKTVPSCDALTLQALK